ncbi:ABC transporter permease [Embleya sp. NBC_00888]|uniref:ABC transporter permease n=1 Tax=Embleya sp. NBC_00888 TaxID=2975960 RepID=UPI00386FF625|nr:ABC transporter permease [Embleya sp. NBC_00888]
MSLLRPNGLARTSVRFRPASFAGSFVALLFAAMLVTMCGVFMESGIRAHATPERYADTPVLVSGPNDVSKRLGKGEGTYTESAPLPERTRLDAGLAGRIAAVPGVGSVIPDVTFPAQTERAVVDGHGWSSAPLAGTREGTAPRAGEVVLTTAAAGSAKVGDTVRLTTPGGEVALRVSGVLPGRGAHLYVPDADAQRLAGHPGTVTAIGVLPAAGADTGKVARDVRAALTGTGAKVSTGDDRGAAEYTDFGNTKEMFTAIGGTLGGIVLMVAIFVVAGATALSVGQRRRDIALLRAVGATPWQIRRMIATETGLVSLVAGVVGVLPGTLLARWWFAAMDDRGLVAHGVTLSVGWIPMVVAVGAGTLTALGAGLLAARRSAKIKPTEALGDAAVERVFVGWIRLVLGLGALGGGIAVTRIALNATGDDAIAAAGGVIMLFMLAIGLLGPILAHVCVSVFGWVGSLFGTTGQLAFDNARANSRRLASAITPIALAVAFAATLSFMFAAEDHHASVQSRDAVTADRVLAGPGFIPQTTAKVAGTPGVASVTSVLNTAVVVVRDGGLQKQSAQGIGGTAQDLASTLDLGVREGSTDALRPGAPQPAGGAVALDREVASALHGKVGKPVSMWLGDGTAIDPVVVAIYDRGLGTAGVTLPRAAVETHVETALDTRLLVRFVPGADTRAADAALTGLTQRHPGASVQDRAAYATQVDKDRETNKWLNYIMLVILAGFATIAAINTMAVTTAARNRELGLMRMIGSTHGQVRAVLRREAIMVGAIGLGLGMSVAMATLVPFNKGSFDTSTPYVPLPLCLAISAAALLLAPLTVAPVARRLLRLAPIDAVGAKE